MEKVTNADGGLLDPHIEYEIDQPIPSLKHWRLLINGVPSICPFQTVHAIPANNDINFYKQPCTTECPATKISKEGDEYKYEVGCLGFAKKVTVKLKAEEKIIKMKTIITPE